MLSGAVLDAFIDAGLKVAIVSRTQAKLDARETELNARERNLPFAVAAREGKAVKSLTVELLSRNAREAQRAPR